MTASSVEGCSVFGVVKKEDASDVHEFDGHGREVPACCYVGEEEWLIRKDEVRGLMKEKGRMGIVGGFDERIVSDLDAFSVLYSLHSLRIRLRIRAHMS